MESKEDIAKTIYNEYMETIISMMSLATIIGLRHYESEEEARKLVACARKLNALLSKGAANYGN